MFQRKFFLWLMIASLLAGCTLQLGFSNPDRQPVASPAAPVAAPPDQSDFPISPEAVTPGAAGAPDVEAAPTEQAVPSEPSTSILVPSAAEVVDNARYTVQSGTPAGAANFIDPAAGCNWMGVAGQAFNLNAEPVIGLVAVLGGSLGGNALSQLAETGKTPALGPGGYLIPLGNRPVQSSGTLWIQLFDNAGSPLSNRFYFDTFAECERNLILINFAEITTERMTFWFPWVGKQRLYYYFPLAFKP